MRRVRGTALDVFGYSRHRREERSVATEYGNLLGTVLAGLESSNYAAAVSLARSAAAIKGYDDIKSASIRRWRADVTGLVALLESPS
jgi:indolepyruvate ferredoxin oxidoreductase